MCVCVCVCVCVCAELVYSKFQHIVSAQVMNTHTHTHTHTHCISSRSSPVTSAHTYTHTNTPHTLYMYAQIYGNQRKSKDLRDRWNAKGIDLLMRRHPALRVAYVESSGQGKPSYSVLLRARGADPVGYERAVIEEVYRVRGPSNPYSGRGVIIGEGKVSCKDTCIHTHTHTHTSNLHSGRAVIIGEGKVRGVDTHAHTHTHTEREHPAQVCVIQVDRNNHVCVQRGKVSSWHNVHTPCHTCGWGDSHVCACVCVCVCVCSLRIRTTQ